MSGRSVYVHCQSCGFSGRQTLHHGQNLRCLNCKSSNITIGR